MSQVCIRIDRDSSTIDTINPSLACWRSNMGFEQLSNCSQWGDGYRDPGDNFGRILRTELPRPMRPVSQATAHEQHHRDQHDGDMRTSM